MTTLEILGVPLSNFVCSVRIALEEKGVDYTLVSGRPHTPEIDAVHPLGKIPCMRHGDFTLCESRAIVGYVERTFPGPKLFPEDAKSAALVEQWVSMGITTIIPAFQKYLVAYFFPNTADGEPDLAAAKDAFVQVETYMGVLDRAVATTGHLAGNNFTYADIVILPMLAYLKELPESGAAFTKFPALSAYFDKHSKRPSFVKAGPPPMNEVKAILKQIRAARAAAAE